jgi:hypothetical protein
MFSLDGGRVIRGTEDVTRHSGENPWEQRGQLPPSKVLVVGVLMIGTYFITDRYSYY